MDMVDVLGETLAYGHYISVVGARSVLVYGSAATDKYGGGDT